MEAVGWRVVGDGPYAGPGDRSLSGSSASLTAVAAAVAAMAVAGSAVAAHGRRVRWHGHMGGFGMGGFGMGWWHGRLRWRMGGFGGRGFGGFGGYGGFGYGGFYGLGLRAMVSVWATVGVRSRLWLATVGYGLGYGGYGYGLRRLWPGLWWLWRLGLGYGGYGYPATAMAMGYGVPVPPVTGCHAGDGGFGYNSAYVAPATADSATPLQIGVTWVSTKSQWSGRRLQGHEGHQRLSRERQRKRLVFRLAM